VHRNPSMYDIIGPKVMFETVSVDVPCRGVSINIVVESIVTVVDPYTRAIASADLGY